VDFLKIDGQFMHNVTRDQIDRSLVEAIAQIGQTMGIRTVAERVDSADVLARLAEIGIEYAQDTTSARRSRWRCSSRWCAPTRTSCVCARDEPSPTPSPALRERAG